MKRSNQDWTIGQTVKVGFLQLTVFDVKGNEYILVNSKGNLYSFTPYHGLNKITNDKYFSIKA